MNALEEFTNNASEVVARLDDSRLAMLCRILAVSLICRGARPGRALLDAAEELERRAAAEGSAALAIFSSDCGLPPPV